MQLVFSCLANNVAYWNKRIPCCTVTMREGSYRDIVVTFGKHDVTMLKLKYGTTLSTIREALEHKVIKYNG